MKQQGVITFYNPERKFGFIEQSVPVDGGFIIRRYFLVRSAIIFKQTTIKEGCTVRFNPCDKAPNKPNGLNMAVDVEVFDPMTAAKTSLDVLAGGEK